MTITIVFIILEVLMVKKDAHQIENDNDNAEESSPTCIKVEWVDISNKRNLLKKTK